MSLKNLKNHLRQLEAEWGHRPRLTFNCADGEDRHFAVWHQEDGDIPSRVIDPSGSNMVKHPDAVDGH